MMRVGGTRAGGETTDTREQSEGHGGMQTRTQTERQAEEKADRRESVFSEDAIEAWHRFILAAAGPEEAEE